MIKGKRFNESKLTDDERTEVLKYATAGTVLVAVAFLFGLFGWFNLTISMGVGSVGFMIIAFIWGYVGAIESERTGTK